MIRVAFVAWNSAYGIIEKLGQPVDEEEFSRLRSRATFIIVVQLIDIFITSNTAYFHDEEGLVRDKRRILERYACGWFIFDLLWVIPARAIAYFIMEGDPVIRVSGWVNLVDVFTCL